MDLHPGGGQSLMVSPRGSVSTPVLFSISLSVTWVVGLNALQASLLMSPS